MTLSPSRSDLAYRDNAGLWHVTDLKDCMDCLGNEQQLGKAAMRAVYAAHAGMYFQLIGFSPFLLEGSLHDFLYHLIEEAFASRTIARLAPHIQEIADELLAAVETRQGCDLVSTYAYPLPFRIICELVGVVGIDTEPLRRLMDELAFGHDPLKSPEEACLANQAATQLHEIFSYLIEERRKEPTADFISSLLQAQQQKPEILTDTLISGTCFSVFLAGHDNSRSLITNLMVDLLQNQEQLAFLRDHPEFIGRAVEVSMAKDSPTAFTMRSTKNEICLAEAGVTIPAHCPVVVHIAQANRQQFFGESVSFDVHRPVQGHCGFGAPKNRYCPGAHLARLEARIAVETLLKRFPTIRLAVDPSALKRRETTMQPVLETLPVLL